MPELAKKWWQTRKRGWWRVFRNLPVFWLHQRTTKMDRTDLFFHFVVNGLFFLASLALLLAFEWPEERSIQLLVAFVIARSLSFVLLNNFWDGMMRCFPFVNNGGKQKIVDFIINSQKRLANNNSIHACAVFGSLVRGEFHTHSDLDVRYLRLSGFSNAIQAWWFVAKERLIALILRVPLDSYLYDSEGMLDRLRSDERPLVLKDSLGKLKNRYKNTIDLQSL